MKIIIDIETLKGELWKPKTQRNPTFEHVEVEKYYDTYEND